MEENKLDKDIKKEADRLDNEKYMDLAKQCQAEFDLAWAHQKPKKDEALLRLRLYNNQRRDKKAVGDTTMFTTFQTILASLYVDQLISVWSGREEGDDEVAENLNALARADYEDMGKNETDFDWIFDTCFFGRGLLEFSEYIRDPDKNVFLPVPEVIDPITFLRDPRAISISGNRMGRNGARFHGREMKMTRDEMKSHPFFFKSNDFRTIKYGNGTKSLIEDGFRARADAQGNQYDRNNGEGKLGVNGEYDITQWDTHWMYEGKVTKCRVWLANDRRLVVGFKPYKIDRWTTIDRPLYPTSHNWDGTSIPDLTEDKQRARAVAQNLGLNAMKADLYPMYIYDTNRIKNKGNLGFNFNKFIPADVQPGQSVEGSIVPMRKAFPNLPLLSFIYESLDASAQKATATPDIQQGMQSAKDRPLGETNLLKGGVDTRYSLSAKIFGWSEKKFWLYWYGSYKENFANNIDQKVVRIVGAFGDKWRKFTKENITTKNIDPDVSIESTYVNRAKMLEERTNLSQYFAMVMADPTANKRYALKKLGKVYGMPKDEIDRLLPMTIDERIAEDQNMMLNDNKLVPVLPEDDHNVHLEIHAKAAPTAATYAHIETHKRALSIKKTNPELFPADQTDTTFQDKNTKQMPTGPTPQPMNKSLNAGGGGAAISTAPGY